jgi:hypothetical protein
MPLVVKDSWQYPEQEEEGKLLHEAMEKGVVNVARYYDHETVRVAGEDDGIRKNVRKGLDITKATNYNVRKSIISPNTSGLYSSTRKTGVLHIIHMFSIFGGVHKAACVE